MNREIITTIEDEIRKQVLEKLIKERDHLNLMIENLNEKISLTVHDKGDQS